MSGGAVHLPPDGSGLRLTVTAPSSSTARRSSGRQVAGSTPGDWGSIAPIANRSGNRVLTRCTRSLQIRAQVEETSKSPMWWAMKLARGLRRS